MEEIQTLQQINVLGDATLTGEINVTNNTNSSSFTTGSITLAGGLGVAKDVFVNGVSNSTNVNLLDANGTTIASQYFTNGTTWKLENNVGSQIKTLEISQSGITLNQNTPSTSTTTGALTVVGGISTQDNVYARGNVVATTTNTMMTSSTPLGADSNVKNGIIFMGKSGLVNDNSGNLLLGINTNHFGTRNNANQGGVIKINTETSANPVFDFSVIQSGATGQTSLLTVDQNGSVKIQSSTNSTSTTTGALQVAGGMVVAKNINVGGTLSLWDGANSGSISETGTNLNISSTNISLTGNVQLNGNVQISGNVTLNGSSVGSNVGSSSGSDSGSTSQNDTNILDDCMLHTHIYNLENPTTTKTMLTSSYPLKDYSNNTTIALTKYVWYFYAVRLIKDQNVKGVYFWSNSTNTTVRTALFGADGSIKVSLDRDQTINGNSMKYLSLTNTTWTVDATGIFYVGIYASSDSTSIIGTSVNTYSNYSMSPISGKLSLPACEISFNIQNNVNNSLYFTNGIARTSGSSDFAFSSGTLEAWVKTSQTGSYAGIAMKTFSYSLYLLNGKLTAYDWQVSSPTSSNASINNNTWNHVAITWQSGVSNGSKLYINGVVDKTFTYNVGSSNENFSIGNSTASQPFVGYVDEVRVWDIVVSDANILANYNKKIAPTTSGLKGYFKMDEGSGTVLNNAVSGGPNANISGSTSWSTTDYAPIIETSSNIDNSLYFTNGIAKTSSSSDFNFSSGTLEAWIKTSQTGSYAGIVLKSLSYSLYLLNGKLSAYDWQISSATSSNASINDDVLHHVAITWQSGVTNGSKLYIDGVVDKTFTYNVASSNEFFSIGNSSTNQNQPFVGYIDEVRVWDIVVSDANILANYNKKIAPTTPGLKGYFKMDEGSGTILSNAVSGGPNLNISGSVTWTMTVAPLYSVSSFISGGSTPTALSQIAYVGVYKDGV